MDEFADTLTWWIRASGRVHGVGFRYHVLNHARRLGVSGWVRNEPDGSVLIAAKGLPSVLEMLLEEVRRGPRSARVDAVETAPAPDSTTSDIPELFEVRY